MSDIVEPEGDLWTWVVRSGGQGKDAIWPPDSETAAWDLATAWSQSAKALRDAVSLSDSAAAELRKAWTDAAGFELYYAVHSLNNGSLGEPGVKEMAVAMDSLSTACRGYGDLIVKAKHEIRRNISENNRLFDRCTSWAARTVFAIQVAQQLAKLITGFAGQVGKPAGEDSKPPKKPKPQGFWGNVGAFFVGIGEGAVEMAVGFAALAGYGDGHFSWSTFGEAWKGLGKFGLAAATYSVPGLSAIDQSVGLPGFGRGEMGHTLVEAGKVMVAWDTWSEDPSRAAGKTTFNIASAVLGTKGAGAAIRGTGAAAAGSRVGAVAAVGRVVEHAGSAITKIPTGTELAAKAVRKIPGVDTLLSKAGLVHSPSVAPAHAGDTPPPPHNPPGGHTPDERPPTNPPGDKSPEGPPPERPPNKPPDEKTPNHGPEEQRPNRSPEERTPSRRPEETSPDRTPVRQAEPPVRSEPTPRPGSVGESLGQGGHHASGKDTPSTGAEQGAPAAKPNNGDTPAARNPEAAGHPAREADQPKASINRDTQEVRMSDRIDSGDMRESVGSKNDEIVRLAQEQWAASNPVEPRTPTQTAIYTVARVAGLVHAAENIVTGHHGTPGSPPPPLPSPKDHTPSSSESAPKDRDKASSEEKSTSDSLPPGDPGLPPKHGDNYFAHVDLESGKVHRVDPPESPPQPKPEPPAPTPGPTPRPAGAASEVPAAPPRQAPRTHPSNLADMTAEPAPRRPGSRMPFDGTPWDQGARRPEIPMRGGDHAQHPQHAQHPEPSRAPDEGVPPATDIHSAINPESAPARADSAGAHEGGHRDGGGDEPGDPRTPDEDTHEPGWQDRPDENGRTPRQKIADEKYLRANYYEYPGKDGPELRVNPRRNVNNPDYDANPPPVDLVDGQPRFKSERPPAEFQGFDRERSDNFPPRRENQPESTSDRHDGDPAPDRHTPGEDVDTRNWRERDYDRIDEKIADRQAKQDKLDETPESSDEWTEAFNAKNDASEVLGEEASHHAIRDRLHRDFSEAFPDERFDVRPHPDAPEGSQRYQIVDADGTVRADITPRHPTGGGKPGPGNFDHIWEVRYEGVKDPHYIVHEAKGPGGKPSTRYLKAEDRVVRQGHPDYYDDLVAKTRKTDPGLADALERAKLQRRLDYIEIRARVDESVTPHVNLGYDFKPYGGFGYESPLPKPPKPNEE